MTRSREPTTAARSPAVQARRAGSRRDARGRAGGDDARCRRCGRRATTPPRCATASPPSASGSRSKRASSTPRPIACAREHDAASSALADGARGARRAVAQRAPAPRPTLRGAARAIASGSARRSARASASSPARKRGCARSKSSRPAARRSATPRGSCSARRGARVRTPRRRRRSSRRRAILRARGRCAARRPAPARLVDRADDVTRGAGAARRAQTPAAAGSSCSTRPSGQRRADAAGRRAAGRAGARERRARDRAARGGHRAADRPRADRRRRSRRRATLARTVVGAGRDA